MVAIEVTDEVDEDEFNTDTKITTKSIQIDTGVTIRTISSPNESRRLDGLGFEAIGNPEFGSMSDLGGR